jgi:DNA-3-methyladenine glycosylase II
MSRAAAIQVRIAEASGDLATIDRQVVASFPRPQSILNRNAFPGVSAEKWSRLQAVARAALDGQLEAKDLLALPLEEARERLLRIHGVGSWTADGILIRGCGPTDILPLREPLLHAAVALTYGMKTIPNDDEVSALAKDWRPFRTWVSVLLISEHFDRARQLLRQNSPLTAAGGTIRGRSRRQASRDPSMAAP